MLNSPKELSKKLPKILADWPLWGLSDAPISIEQFKPLSGGLNNQCFLLDCAPASELESRRFVLRIAGTDFGLDRSLEFRLHTFLSAQNLTVKIHYCAPDFSYWLREFVEGEALTPDQLNPNVLTQLLAQLKQVHQLTAPSFMPEFSLQQTAYSYWQQLAQMGQVESFRVELFQDTGSEQKLSLCHMDPTAANWICTTAGDFVLLDWEYAALGNPLWDIAVLVEQAKLSAAEEQQVLANYGEVDLNAWRRAKAQMRYVSQLWYQLREYHLPRNPQKNTK